MWIWILLEPILFQQPLFQAAVIPGAKVAALATMVARVGALATMVARVGAIA